MEKFERIGLEYISVNFKEQLLKNNFKEQLYLFEQAPRNGLYKRKSRKAVKKIVFSDVKVQRPPSYFRGVFRILSSI